MFMHMFKENNFVSNLIFKVKGLLFIVQIQGQLYIPVGLWAPIYSRAIYNPTVHNTYSRM